MANLFGATVESDKRDFEKVFTDEGIKPDEIKIYPTILVRNAELYEYWKRGEYKPYKRKELSEVILHALPRVPRYTRINRLFRDFPSPNIVAGEKHINFRQIIEQEADRYGIKNENIRRREIGSQGIDISFDPVEEIIKYNTRGSEELFISYNTKDDKLLGFLRLSLPEKSLSLPHFIEELENCAIIREVHVYGPAQNLAKKGSKAQHKGFGTRLIERAVEIAKEKNYPKLAVISAIGTREYYKKRGFKKKGMYQIMNLS
jgi:elongator complex protein 3